MEKIKDMKLFQFIKNDRDAKPGEHELLFKTNMKCGGCVATVKPFLDEAKDIESWEVDLNVPDKVLKVKSAGISSEKVQELINKAGFKAEKL